MKKSALAEVVKDQERVIEFLKNKYYQDTGMQVTVPVPWAKFLNIEDEQAPIFDSAREEVKSSRQGDTFLTAFYALNLPQKLAGKDAKQGPAFMNPTSPATNSFGGGKSTKKATKGGKKNITTTFNPTNPYHMVESINLSDFASRVFICLEQRNNT